VLVVGTPMTPMRPMTAQQAYQDATGVSLRPPSATAIAALVISLMSAVALIVLGIVYGTTDNSRPCSRG
jgi:hypothetical protein